MALMLIRCLVCHATALLTINGDWPEAYEQAAQEAEWDIRGGHKWGEGICPDHD